MGKQPKVDHEILAILEDYHLFMDCDKHVDMPFCVNKVDDNHVTSLKGESELIANSPLGNTILECEMREHDEYNYTFKILSDGIQSRLLFRLDEGSKAHRNWHLPVPIEQQQVTTPHFHRFGDDGIMCAYKNEDLRSGPTPLNISEGFVAFCKECHINDDKVALVVHEEGTLPFPNDPEKDPLKGIQFP